MAIVILFLIPLGGYLYFQGYWILEPLPDRTLVPQMTIYNLAGKSIQSDSIIHQKTIIIFFSTTCPHCKVLMNTIVSIYRDFDESVAFVGISLDDEMDTKKFVATMNIPFPVYCDTDDRARKAFHVLPIPAIFFINEHRILIHHETGEQNRERLQLQFKQFKEPVSDSLSLPI